MSPGPTQVVADRYRLISPLGQGGMGRVWRATDVVLHREVAIKELVPPPGLTAEERQEMRERSLREARAIARLNNINVVRVFDVLRTDADPWIVMEYVPSRSLHDHLASDGPVSAERAAEIGLGVLGALRAAHRAGVVHRDVKPANVLLGEDGRVVLTDFGLATVPGDPNVTRTGLVLGSPAYIAPERARDGTAGPKADLWSLGATLYAAVEGASPYARPSAIATLAALATENPPPARNAGGLKPVLNGLLRKDPNQRISADEAERLLRRVGGRRTRLGFPMSPTMRRPGVGRDREAAGPPVVPGAAAPVVPGPRPPASPVSGGRPTFFRPGKATVGQPAAAVGTPARPAPETPTRVDTPAVKDEPVRAAAKVDTPTRFDTPAINGDPAVQADAPATVDTPTRVDTPVVGAYTPTRVDLPAVTGSAPTTGRTATAQPDAPTRVDPPVINGTAATGAGAPVARIDTPTRVDAPAIDTDAPGTDAPGPVVTTTTDTATRVDPPANGAGAPHQAPTARIDAPDRTDTQADKTVSGGARAGTTSAGTPPLPADADASTGSETAASKAETPEAVESKAETPEAAASKVETAQASKVETAEAAASKVERAETAASKAETAAQSETDTAGTAPAKAEASAAATSPAAAGENTAEPLTHQTQTGKPKSADAEPAEPEAGTTAAASLSGAAPRAATAAPTIHAQPPAKAKRPAKAQPKTRTDKPGTRTDPGPTMAAATPAGADAPTAEPNAGTTDDLAAQAGAAPGSPAVTDAVPAGTPAPPSTAVAGAPATLPGSTAGSSPGGTPDVTDPAPEIRADQAADGASAPTGATPKPGRTQTIAGAQPSTRAQMDEPADGRAGGQRSGAVKSRKHKSKAARAAAARKDPVRVEAPVPVPAPSKPVGTRAAAAGAPTGRQAGRAVGEARRTGAGVPGASRTAPGKEPSLLQLVGRELVKSRRRMIVLVAAVLLVVVLAVVAVVAGYRDKPSATPGPGPTTAPVVPPSAAASSAAPPSSAAPSPSPSSAPSSSAPAQAAPLPQGWRLHEDPTGFKVPVPANWSVRKVKTETYFQEPGANGGRLLIIDQTDTPNGEPVQDWKNKEKERDYPGYQRIGIVPVPMGREAADWEYRYNSKDGNRLHVRKRGVVFRDDQAYGISWVVGDDEWDESLGDLDVIIKGFVPAPE